MPKDKDEPKEEKKAKTVAPEDKIRPPHVPRRQG